MNKLLDMTEDERRARRGFEDLTFDREGREVFWGLSFEESQELLRLKALEASGSQMDVDRFLELDEKFKYSRAAVINVDITSRKSGNVQ